MDGYGRAQDTRVQAGRGTLSSDSGPVLSPPQVLPLDLTLEVSIACTQLGHEALGLEAELLPSLGLIMPFWDVDMGWREAGPYCRHICSAHMCPRTHGQLGAGLLGQAADMHAARVGCWERGGSHWDPVPSFGQVWDCCSPSCWYGPLLQCTSSFAPSKLVCDPLFRK